MSEAPPTGAPPSADAVSPVGRRRPRPPRVPRRARLGAAAGSPSRFPRLRPRPPRVVGRLVRPAPPAPLPPRQACARDRRACLDGCASSQPRRPATARPPRRLASRRKPSRRSQPHWPEIRRRRARPRPRRRPRRAAPASSSHGPPECPAASSSSAPRLLPQTRLPDRRRTRPRQSPRPSRSCGPGALRLQRGRPLREQAGARLRPVGRRGDLCRLLPPAAPACPAPRLLLRRLPVSRCEVPGRLTVGRGIHGLFEGRIRSGPDTLGRRIGRGGGRLLASAAGARRAPGLRLRRNGSLGVGFLGEDAGLHRGLDVLEGGDHGVGGGARCPLDAGAHGLAHLAPRSGDRDDVPVEACDGVLGMP